MRMQDFKKKNIRNQRTLLLRNVRKKRVQKKPRWDAFRRILRTGAVTTGMILLAGSVGSGIYAMSKSPLFLVKKIIFQGDPHLSEESLQTYEERLGTNIFFLKLKSVQRDLLQEPYVKKVFLRRELPDRVTVRIEERKPFALLQMDNKSFLIDQDGRILERLSEKGDTALPVIDGIEQDQNGVWKEELSQALSLIMTIKNYGYPDFEEIDLIEMTKKHGAVLRPSGGGFEIRCGIEDFLHKMILLKRVTADLSRREWMVGHIDLRFQGQVVVGLKET